MTLGMSNREAIIDVAKTYRWSALFLSTALALVAYVRANIR